MQPSPASIIARLLNAAAKSSADSQDDHTIACTAHSGATKAHDWMVSVLGPLWTLGQNTARGRGQRRPTSWRCGGEELPEGSSRELKLSL